MSENTNAIVTPVHTTPQTVVLPDLNEFTNKVFDNIIGQHKTKNEVKFHLEGYLFKRMIPVIMLIASKGQGKTKISRAVAKGCYQFDENGQPFFVQSVKDPTIMVPKRKDLVEVNCASLGSSTSFVTNTVIPHILDKDVTVFFDEASEIPKKLSMDLLTLLDVDPMQPIRTFKTKDGYQCDFDLRRQTFIFATSEPQKVFHALMDRMERISLQDYTRDEMAQIIQVHTPQINYENGVLYEMAQCLRNNARSAVKLSDKITTLLKYRTKFTAEDWEELRHRLNIIPLGLNDTEIQILRYLAANPNGISLTRLSAKTGFTRDALQKDVESYLQKHDLMEVNKLGRVITPKGLEYLKALDFDAANRTASNKPA